MSDVQADDEHVTRLESGIFLPKPDNGFEILVLQCDNAQFNIMALHAEAEIWAERINAAQLLLEHSPEEFRPIELVDPHFGGVWYLTAVGVRAVRSVCTAYAQKVDPAAFEAAKHRLDPERPTPPPPPRRPLLVPDPFAR